MAQQDKKKEAMVFAGALAVALRLGSAALHANERADVIASYSDEKQRFYIDVIPRGAHQWKVQVTIPFDVSQPSGVVVLGLTHSGDTIPDEATGFHDVLSMALGFYGGALCADYVAGIDWQQVRSEVEAHPWRMEQ